jgi:hypothetical protein
MKKPMKTTVTSLLATIAMAFTASASPSLLVETTITENHAKGGKDVLAAPSITVESGKQASIQVGKLEYAVTPTLLDNGTVDLRAVLTERDGEKVDRLAAPQIKAKLGKVAEIQIGDLTFTTKTSLAKQ